MISDQELREIVASLATGSKKTDEQLAKTDEQLAKTDAQLAKTDKKLAKIIKLHGGYIDNQAKSTERYFVRSLEKQDLEIANVPFDEIYPNFTKRTKKKELELDALLVNGNYVGILEVKTTLHKNDVQKIYEKSIKNFRDICKEYRDKKLMVIVAGEDILQDAKKLANKYGFVCMSKKDEKIAVSFEGARFY